MVVSLSALLFIVTIPCLLSLSVDFLAFMILSSVDFLVYTSGLLFLPVISTDSFMRLARPPIAAVPTRTGRVGFGLRDPVLILYYFFNLVLKCSACIIVRLTGDLIFNVLLSFLVLWLGDTWLMFF